MARNDIFVEAPPERVFDVLSEPSNYGHWVVGSREIRGADPGFPGLGTKFDHSVGWGPLHVNDHTVVEDVEKPHRLVLKAKARPFGTARVTLHLASEDGGTRVTMLEDPGDPLSAVTFHPLSQILLRGRNAESLRRLKELAEDR